MLLNNGCLCCTVRGDLVRMISELVTSKKGKFDHIVIETTGMQLSNFKILHCEMELLLRVLVSNMI